jgi:serine protease Do
MKSIKSSKIFGLGLAGILFSTCASAQNFHGWPGGGALSPTEASDSFLGVYFDEVTGEDVETFRLPDERGAKVLGVMENSPAEESGLMEEDVIVSWNGARLESGRQLKRLVGETPPGRSVKLKVIRGGSEVELDAEIGTRDNVLGGSPVNPWFQQGTPFPNWHPPIDEPDIRHEPDWNAFEEHSSRPKLGVMLQSLTEQFGEFLGIEGDKGAIIFEVIEDTPAQSAGLRAGDVIVAIEDEKMDTPLDVQKKISDSSGTVEVRIVRNKVEDIVKVELNDTNSVNADVDLPADAQIEEEEPVQYPKSAM